MAWWKSTRLAEVDRSASANEVLSDVLGVPFPQPLWVENEIDRIVKSVADRELTRNLLAELRSELTEIGLGDYFPEVLDRLLPQAGSGENR